MAGYDLRTQVIEVKRRVGFVPESGAVFESLTGLEYLELVAALYAIPQAAALARIRQFIAFFDLSFATLTDKLLGAYSKGMRRKVRRRADFVKLCASLFWIFSRYQGHSYGGDS